MTRRDQIIEAALRLSEEVGVERVSMRMIGERIGTSAMAIYRHLPNRGALLDAVVGRVLAAVPLPDAELAWSERLRVVAHGLYDAAVAHPSVFPMALTRSYAAEPAVSVMRVMYDILDDAGIDPADVPRVERLLSTALLGYVVTASSGGFWPIDPSPTTQGWNFPEADRRVPDPDSAKHPGVWRAELDANVDDLVRLIEALARN